MLADPRYLKSYAIAFIGFTAAGTFGWWLDRLETERMTRFRDKSKLYGRELKPGEPPSWP
ncbi:NADH dehydrogenase [ubiquinone] 1 beta subcomplex subunit 1 [Calliopsis andreniformis]|uniref:NADH dehydrogenase [ubiquinone] 1 beta subcomplex subunit 1 n=1 Tax=Calliopsis andreniformis TaxID=337506 RepID=UPI003FCD2CCC